MFHTYSIKQPSHEANHSSPSSTKIKSERRYTLTPHVWLRSVYMDNFTLPLS